MNTLHMTPKEKAKEIFHGMYNSIPNHVPIRIHIAKRCASVAINNIMGTLSPYMGDNNARIYWQEVKQEIDKL